MNELMDKMTNGLKVLYEVVDAFGYSALEDMRKEVLYLLAKIENRQDKLRLEALNVKTLEVK